MSKRKIVLVLIVFICFLTGIRLVWLSSHATPEHPHAHQGVLDLTGWDFQTNRSITLDGQWEFYAEQFITPELLDLASSPDSMSASELNKATSNTASTDELTQATSMQTSETDGPTAATTGPTLLEVPGKAPTSYGSYRLKLITPPEESLAIIVSGIQMASQFFINGEPIPSFGTPAEQIEDFVPKNKSYTIEFTSAEDGINEIILHVSNFYGSPEIVKSLKLGSEAAIHSEWMGAIGTQLVMIVIFALHGLYALIIYLFNRNKSLIYFLLLVTCIMVSIASADDKMLLTWFPALDYEWSLKIAFLSYVLLSALLLKLMEVLFYKTNRLFQIMYIAAASYSIVLIASPSLKFIFAIRPVFSLLVFIPVLIIPLTLFKILPKTNSKDSIFILLAGVSVATSLIWGGLHTLGWTSFQGPYPFDMIIALICFATYWFRQYFHHAEQTKQLAEKLQQENLNKDEFLAHASHELRTPLHGMINIAHSVLVDVRENTHANISMQQNLTLLIRIGRRMSSMLSDLLDLAQIRENKITLNPVPIRVQSIASGTMDMLSYVIEGKPVQMIMKIPNAFPLVFADENRLTQILFNLLHNAAKFTEQGTIEIEATRTGNDAAEIIIRDTGIGIDPEKLKSIFDPYEQGDHADASGVGLGLSISKQLLDLHGSTITFESTLGKGTVFRFTLPLAGDHTEQNQPMPLTGYSSSELAASLTTQADNDVSYATQGNPSDVQVDAARHSRDDRPHVLVIDDDSVNLKIIGEILTKHEFSVTLELKGDHILNKLAEMNIDVLILDVMMPGISGYELTRKIRTRFSLSELPILLLTARSQPDDVYAGFQAGANDYVTKPVDALELIYRVKQLTDLKDSIRKQGRMEAAYLQAQIEPHFLFNTLNSISALGEIDTKRMHDMIEAFSNYLRISFDYWNAEPLVTLDHELKLVRSYLYIEQQRFADKLQVTWDVSADTCSQIPPLTLQPIVENAVKHGILQSSTVGTLEIMILQEEQGITFAVKNDGKGMTPAELATLFDEERTGGIGLRNTNRRLIQRYGKGLDIQSRPNEGTVVTFTIPTS